MSPNGINGNGGARSGATRSTRGTASPSKQAKKERPTMQAEPHVPVEMDAERAARLEEKQRQLETVHDRHDNLVCCLCFLNYFRILSYAS